MSSEERAPSVIESPKVATAIVWAGAITSTRAMRNHAPGRSDAVIAGSPTWLPVSDT